MMAFQMINMLQVVLMMMKTTFHDDISNRCFNYIFFQVIYS